MKSILLTTTVLFLLILAACSKDECKTCYLREIENGDTAITEMGVYCNEELKETDGKEYTVSGGSATAFCE